MWPAWSKVNQPRRKAAAKFRVRIFIAQPSSVRRHGWRKI
jgi:hypothetical protein